MATGWNINILEFLTGNHDDGYVSSVLPNFNKIHSQAAVCGP